MFKKRLDMKLEIQQLKSDLLTKSEEIERLLEKNNDLTLELNKELSARQQMKQNYEKVSAELSKIKGIVREQTNADLLFNALQSVGIIQDKGKTDYKDKDNVYRQRLALLQAMNSNARDLTGYMAQSLGNSLLGRGFI